MMTVSLEIKNLARQLLDFEKGTDKTPANAGAVMRVFGKLRIKLTRFAGLVGFSALLSRALVLAKADAPSLGDVQAREDGTLVGLAETGQNAGPEAVGLARVILVAQFLELLVEFIGEPLTLTLVREVWPDASMDKI